MSLVSSGDPRWRLQLREAVVGLMVLGVVGAPVRQARACGPDFDPELLKDRGASLSHLLPGSFRLEAGRLVPKPEVDFSVVESPGGGEPEGARTGGGKRETALYQAGAKAFHAGQMDEARGQFHAVLALPAEERRHFSTFAAYMLGRTASDSEEARSFFFEVRQLVRHGFADPLGLAVASLGEEARTHLKEDDVAAIALYAEQAAHGSASGRDSLQFVARALSLDAERLERALRTPLGQRLMTTYVWTQGHDVWSEDESFHSAPLEKLLEALMAVPRLAGADRLAATAWNEGRFDLAERFAGVEKSPLSAWVQAKLALRRGDKVAADQLLAQAAEGFPPQEDWQPLEYGLALRPYSFVEGERTILALMRDDFPRAAEYAVNTCSWADIAYVAERVLKVEEVQRLLATSTSRPEMDCKLNLFLDDSTVQPMVGDRLRLLLGRRLMREGRGAESLEYFRGTKQEESSRQYVAELDRVRSTSKGVDQAEALYAASRLARNQGMELLGTENAPDWSWTQGAFDLGPLVLAEPGKPTDLTPAERERTAAHVPPHAVRFHYRSTAADLAERAAGLVPPRSQAYAALLCQASRYTRSSEPERSQAFWNTYVKTGALLREPMVFGEQCPEPNFARAREPKPRKPWHLPRKRTLAAVGGGILLPVMGLLFFLRRKRQAPAASNKDIPPGRDS